VNETVVLSIWDGDSPVVVRVDDNTDRVVHIVVRTGSRLARTTSAQGKVFLAFSGEGDELGAKEHDRIRQTRIAVNTQNEDGIRAIATPIFQDRDCVATMAVVGTIANLPAKESAPLCLRLRETADILSAELGFFSDHEQERSAS
jgi:DNA-binding IclR family transcriptional regulator